MYNDPDTSLLTKDFIKVAYNDASGKLVTKSFINNYVIKPSQDANCMTPLDAPLSIPHSATFIDIDGDCMPDLFLTKVRIDPITNNTLNSYEIYT